jgi:hypothetical protein
MAAVFAMSESYGAGPTVADTTYLNLLSASIASGSDGTTVPNANPIAIPGAGSAYSYERYHRAHFTSSFTSIANVKFWKKSGSLGTGVTMNANVKTPNPTVYVTAVNTASSFATTGIPTSQGAGLAPTYASNYTDYIVQQLIVASTAAQGTIGSMTYTYGWDEV